ncbi:tyrosine-type recombinase/integrase [Desulfobacula sp.]
MGVSTTDFFRHIEPFMDYRSTVYDVSDQTIKSNRCDLKLFENFMGDQQYDIITGPAVMDFQYYLKTQRKNCGGSLNRKLFTLRSYSHYLRLQEVDDAEKLPFHDILKIRQGYRNRPDALTANQIKQLLDTIDRSTCLGVRDYAIYALMYLCGLRIGEVFGLDLTSIDLKTKEITVTGKGKRIRTLHLSDELFQILSEYLAVRTFFYKNEYRNALFISKKGNRLAIRTMEDNFKKIVLKSGLQTRFNVSCHTLRHSFASHLNDKEVDMLVIKSLMGHSTTRSTEIYIHPSMQKVKQAMEKLPGVIFMNELIKKGGVIFSFQELHT